MLSGTIGARAVVMTDGDPLAVDLAKSNRDRNLPSVVAQAVHPVKLLWYALALRPSIIVYNVFIHFLLLMNYKGGRGRHRGGSKCDQ